MLGQNQLETSILFPALFQGAGSFTPKSISGLQLWLRADKGTFQDSAKTTVAVSDGDVVGAWVDLSGNGNDALQSTTANKPLLKLNIVNSRPVVRFDGVNDILLSSSVDINNDSVTLFVVVQIISQTGVDILCEMSVSAAANDGFWLASGTSGAAGAGARVRGSITDVTLFIDNPFNGTSIFRIMSLVGNAASVSILYRNGSSIISDTVNFGTIGSDTIYIGARNNSLLPFNGDISEFLVYNSALSDTDRTIVENYLNERYVIF